MSDLIVKSRFFSFNLGKLLFFREQNKKTLIETSPNLKKSLKENFKSENCYLMDQHRGQRRETACMNDPRPVVRSLRLPSRRWNETISASTTQRSATAPDCCDKHFSPKPKSGPVTTLIENSQYSPISQRPYQYICLAHAAPSYFEAAFNLMRFHKKLQMPRFSF